VRTGGGGQNIKGARRWACPGTVRGNLAYIKDIQQTLGIAGYEGQSEDNAGRLVEIPFGLGGRTSKIEDCRPGDIGPEPRPLGEKGGVKKNNQWGEKRQWERWS